MSIYRNTLWLLLIVVSTTVCGEGVAAERYTINIPSLQETQRPVIDGLLDYNNPAEWAGASGGVVGLAPVKDRKAEAVEPNAHFRIAKKDGRLFILVYSLNMPKMPKSTVRQNQGQIWNDDSFEILLNIDGKELHLIVNSQGYYYSAVDNQPVADVWNVAVREIGLETSVESEDVPRGFIVEASIDLGKINITMPANGEVAGFQVALNHGEKNPHATWSPLATHRISQTLGKIVFGGQPYVSKGVSRKQQAGNGMQFPFDIVPAPSRDSFFIFCEPDLVEEYAGPKKMALKIQNEGRVYWQKDINLANRQDIQQAFISWEGWPLGSYQIKACELSQQGESKELWTKTLHIYEKPEWAKYELPDDVPLVPAPYDPVRANERLAKVWGRKFHFGKTPFADQIEVLDEAILSRPIYIQGQIDGEEAAFNVESIEMVSRNKAKAEYRVMASSGPLKVMIDAFVGFDGVVYYQCKLNSEKPVSVENMAFVIPVNRKFAKYYSHYCYEDFSFRDLSTWNSSGPVTDEGLALRWTPFVWIGDETRGLQWFCQTKSGWRPPADDQYIKLDVNNDEVAIHLNVLSKKTTIDKPLEYSFGLMPTPVKPRNYKTGLSGPRVYIDGDTGLMLQSNEQMRYPGMIFPAGKEEFVKEGCVEIDFRIKPEFYRIDRNYLVLESVSGYESKYIKLMYNSAAKGFYLHSLGPRCNINVKYDFKPGKTYRLAVNFGKKIELYVNGRLIKSADYRGSLPEWDRSAYHEIGGYNRVLYGWRFSSRPKTAAELSDISKLKKEDITFHLDNLQTDPTLLRMTSAEVASLAHPAYLHGRWSYNKKSRCLVSGRAYAQMPRPEHFSKIVGADAAVLFYWSKNILGHEGPENIDGFKELVQRCNRIGLKVLPYTPTGITNYSPLYKWYKYEFSRTHPSTSPRSFWTERGQKAFPGQVAISARRNLYQINKMMEAGVGGLYLDGGFYPDELLDNPLAGDVVRDPFTGEKVTFFQVLAMRDMMADYKRLLQYHRPDAIIDAHSSLGWTMPTMAHMDMATNGESLAWHGDIWPKKADLATIAAEYSGSAFGFKGEALFYQSKPVPVEYGMSLMNLFGTTPRCMGWGMYPQRAQALWKLVDEFDIKNAEWMIFSRPEESAFKADIEQVKCSAYVHKGKRALLFVANWSDEDVSTKIEVDWEKLGLDPGSKVHMLNTNILKEMKDGIISIEIKPRILNYIWIGGKK